MAALERSYGAKPALFPALFSLDAPLAPPFAPGLETTTRSESSNHDDAL